MAKGAVRLRIELTGVMAHGAMPQHGRNPLPRGRRASSPASSEVEAQLQDEHGEHEHLGLDLPDADGARWPATSTQINVIPARATVCVDVRTIPGVDHAAMVEAVTAMAREAAEGSGVRVDVEVVDDRPAVDTPGGRPGGGRAGGGARARRRAARPSRRRARRHRRHDPHPRRGGMPTVVYGPGGKWIAHQADEFVEVADIVALRTGLRRGGPAVPRPGAPHDTVSRRDRRNDLTDVAGIAVGHATRRRRRLADRHDGRAARPDGAVGGVDVRGGGPGTRETDLLDPRNLVERVHAVVLTGGSAYGLAAADGVMRLARRRGVGFPVGPRPDDVVPIVPAAVIFDLGRGGDFANRPDARSAPRPTAALAATGAEAVRQGVVGAGTGAQRRSGSRAAIGSASACSPTARPWPRWSWSTRAGRRVDPRDGRAVRRAASASPASSPCWQRRPRRTCERRATGR